MIKGVCGPETPEKQKDFEAILRLHLTVCKAIFDKWSYPPIYRYIDAFGGPGCYDGIFGSPVIFQRVVRAVGINHEAFIYEKDPKNYMSLQRSLSLDGKTHTFLGSNIELIPLLSIRARNQLGLLYCDPPQDEETFDLSFQIMDMVSRSYAKLDLMLYVSASNLKRIRSSKPGVDDLRTRIAPIQKSHWAIRTLREKHQWTFLIGTNFIEWAEWGNRGFYDINSPRGASIFEKANFTKEEQKKRHQPPLTGLMENTSDIQSLGLSGRKPSKGLGAFVRDAITARLRKFII